MQTFARYLVYGGLACCLLAGCRSAKPASEELTSEFLAKQTKKVVEALRRQVPNHNDYYGMVKAAGDLRHSLEALVDIVEEKAQTRKEERKRAADEALKLLKEYRPTLEGMKYDDAEANAKLDAILKLLDEVEKT